MGEGWVVSTTNDSPSMPWTSNRPGRPPEEESLSDVEQALLAFTVAESHARSIRRLANTSMYRRRSRQWICCPWDTSEDLLADGYDY